MNEGKPTLNELEQADARYPHFSENIRKRIGKSRKEQFTEKNLEMLYPIVYANLCVKLGYFREALRVFQANRHLASSKYLSEAAKAARENGERKEIANTLEDLAEYKNKLEQIKEKRRAISRKLEKKISKTF